MRLRRTKRSPIGVEVTPGLVRMIQLEWRGDEGRVSARAEVPLQDAGDEENLLSAEQARLLHRALMDHEFKGNDAVISLPAESTILRHVKVDSVHGQALHDALLFELEDAFPGDTPLVQHLEVGEVMERGEKRHELILLAAGLYQVNRLVDGLEDCGLRPLAIDAGGCALIRCYSRRRRRSADGSVHTAILHVGDSSTLMTIAGGDQALFMKQLPVGTDQLLEIIRQRLDLTREDIRFAARSDEGSEELAPQVTAALRLQIDSLSLEISACLRYHAASRRSQGGLELVLCGCGALIPGLAGALGESLDVTIHRPDPFTPAFSGVEPDERLVRDYPAWSVPLGLALREAAS